MEMVIFEPWVKHVVEGIEIKMPDLRDLFAMSALQGILGTPYGQSAKKTKMLQHLLMQLLMKCSRQEKENEDSSRCCNGL